MPVRNLRRKLLLSLLLAMAVFAILLLYTDVQSLKSTFVNFRWWMLVPVLFMTGLNLLIRYVKWDYYLRVLGIHGVSRSNSVAIFLANYALILTPGKAGGLLKSYFLKQTNDVEISRSMPIVLAERLTDGLGLVMMASLALVSYPPAWPVLAITLIAMAGVMAVTQVRPLALALMALTGRTPLLRRFTSRFHRFYESTYDLLRLKPLLWATVLGTVARATEGMALYFVLLGLGLTPTLSLFEQSIFIAALSNIVGVLAMMPGGLGATEASMQGLLEYFVGLARGPGTFAMLLARFGSLWAAALLGAFALVVKRQVFFATHDEEMMKDGAVVETA